MDDSPPQIGFNNDVRYRGMLFHIQTEDSGKERPHIITHLFADGGHIIRSMRTDYAQHLGRPDRNDVIRQMMRTQHRAMALALRNGHLDAALDVLAKTPASVAAGTAIEATAPAGGVLAASTSGPERSPPPEPGPASETAALPTDPSRLDDSELVLVANAEVASGEPRLSVVPANSLDDLILRQLRASLRAVL